MLGDFAGEYLTRFGVMLLAGDGDFWIYFMGGDSYSGGDGRGLVFTWVIGYFDSIFSKPILKVDWEALRSVLHSTTLITFGTYRLSNELFSLLGDTSLSRSTRLS